MDNYTLLAQYMKLMDRVRGIMYATIDPDVYDRGCELMQQISDKIAELTVAINTPTGG